MKLTGLKGFTLIELLVVIVLLGIVSSFAILSFNITGLESELDEEANRLHALINLAKEDAIIQSQEIKMTVKENNYYFEKYDWDSNNWVEKENKIFRKREIDDGLKINFETETKKLFFKNDDKKEDNKNQSEYGVIYFLSSGELTDFSIKVKIVDDPQVYYLITGNVNESTKIEKITEFEN